MHTEHPKAPRSAEPCSARQEAQPLQYAPRSAEPCSAGQVAQVLQQPGMARLYPEQADVGQPGMARLYPGQVDVGQPGMARLYLEQRQRARRTASWVGALAVLVYVGFILSGVIGR